MSLENQSARWHSRGYLPHLDGTGTSQVVTFRLAGSVPKALLEAWREELHAHSARDAEKEIRRRLDDYLDLGQGVCWLADPRIGRLVQSALLHFDRRRYDLNAWVIMPNHVHVLFTPRPGHDLWEVVHSWKSFSAQRANAILRRKGEFWQREYFDRAIRDERHFAAALTYIEANPVKAGLCSTPEEWVFGSAAFRLGESFDGIGR